MIRYNVSQQIRVNFFAVQDNKGKVLFQSKGWAQLLSAPL